MPVLTDVFVSSLLAARHPSLHAQLGDQLRRFGVPLRGITGTRDIWCRDYMPVAVGDGRFVQFRYEPSYLADIPKRITSPGVADQVVGDVRRSTLNVDGGNVVRRGRIAVVTDKIFAENPGVSKGDVEAQLRAELEIERLVVIPVEGGDMFGHSDGVVHLLNEGSAFVNDYSEIDPRYGEAIAHALRQQGVEPVPLPYAPDLESRRAVPPATGLYVNLLETQTAMFVPTYGIAQDEAVLRIVEAWAGDRPVVAIDCSDLARGGGALRCATWQASV